MTTITKIIYGVQLTNEQCIIAFVNEIGAVFDECRAKCQPTQKNEATASATAAPATTGSFTETATTTTKTMTVKASCEIINSDSSVTTSATVTTTDTKTETMRPDTPLLDDLNFCEWSNEVTRILKQSYPTLEILPVDFEHDNMSGGTAEMVIGVLMDQTSLHYSGSMRLPKVTKCHEELVHPFCRKYNMVPEIIVYTEK